MKKVLVLSDIHANFPALKAIIQFTGLQDFDYIINAGDTTVYHVFPNETIDWFRRQERSCCILGNTDAKVLDIVKGTGLERPRKNEKRLMYFWTVDNLDPENLEFLSSLPRQAELTVDGVRIGIFHGSPAAFEEKIFPDADEKRFRSLSSDHRYDVIITGHTHVPFWKRVDGINFVNPGSVGRMFDSDPRASFAVLRIAGAGVEVEHFRVPYPIEDGVVRINALGLPEIYCEMYRRGQKLN